MRCWRVSASFCIWPSEACFLMALATTSAAPNSRSASSPLPSHARLLCWMVVSWWEGRWSRKLRWRAAAAQPTASGPPSLTNNRLSRQNEALLSSVTRVSTSAPARPAVKQFRARAYCSSSCSCSPSVSASSMHVGTTTGLSLVQSSAIASFISRVVAFLDGSLKSSASPAAACWPLSHLMMPLYTWCAVCWVRAALLSGARDGGGGRMRRAVVTSRKALT
mmetsp:Transcript_17693/g.50322  ORF Transcript_17693/g.50322 Transcript_17693/m.50322 type:complete len:221 (+) Transcript_17693:227-889(+)